MNRLTFLLILLITTPLNAALFKVAFLVPDHAEDQFWGKTVQFMQAVANDLDIELTVYFNVEAGYTNRFHYKQRAHDLLTGQNKPDYLIFVHLKGVGHRILAEAEQAKVHSFIVTSEIPKNERTLFGYPRGRYQYWLGVMSPDEVQAGFVLATALLKQARKNNPDELLSLLAISGSFNSVTSHYREQGLLKAIQAFPNTHLLKIFHSHQWDKKDAQQKTRVMLKRFPTISMIWTAGDDMAVGASQAVAQANYSRPVAIGGIDWTDEALQNIKQKKLNASVGGHFIQAGLILLLLYDYHYGLDFKQALGTEIKTPMQLINADNIDKLSKILGGGQFNQIDFRQLTKKHAPNQEYQLDVLSVLKTK